MAQWTEEQDWHEPDLDRGIIAHKTLAAKDVGLLPRTTVLKVLNAADRFADQAEAEGVAVIAEEWLIGGKENANW